MNFLYQQAREAASYARLVFNRYYKRDVADTTIEPVARIKIELGYNAMRAVGENKVKEFHTSKHLNMALEAYVAKRMESIVEELVRELETKADRLAVESLPQIEAELERVRAVRAAAIQHLESTK